MARVMHDYYKHNQRVRLGWSEKLGLLWKICVLKLHVVC